MLDPVRVYSLIGNWGPQKSKKRIQHLWSTNYVPGTVGNAGNMAANKTGVTPGPQGRRH